MAGIYCHAPRNRTLPIKVTVVSSIINRRKKLKLDLFKFQHAFPSTFCSISQRIHGPRCCSGAPDARTPQFLKFAVSGVTEFLRLISSSSSGKDSFTARNEITVSSIDDVVMILKSDFENAYFVTGNFTSAVYAEDCIFEDPTIRFQGTELYARNLKLLVPFFVHPSIGLQKIEKCINSETNLVLATWKLRTYLNLPWRPLICINGKTAYELDDNFQIARHAESWDVSAIEAVGQIFTPSFGRPSD